MNRHMQNRSIWLATTLALMVVSLTRTGSSAREAVADDAQRRTVHLLLLGQQPDGHPWGTHEYLAGMRILTSCLADVPGLETTIKSADEPWTEGPTLIDRADGVVLFLSEGAKWVHQDPARLAAFKRLAGRGGGIVALHWAMGCRDAEYIEEFVKLAGGCHGGPDRKYLVAETIARVAAPDHPIMRGIEPVRVLEEFYYQLKFIQPPGQIVPLLQADLEGGPQTVAWAWQRPDGGRSFGFSGLHFHNNWRLEPYRRMVTQAVLWTNELEVPETGLKLQFDEEDLRAPRPKPAEE